MNPADDLDLMTLILLREGSIQIGQALALLAEKQACRRQGRIASSCGLALAFRYITIEQALAAAALYRALAVQAHGWRPLGIRLLAAGLVTPRQLVAALERQRTEDARLGRILVEAGHLSALQIEMFLSLQLNAIRAAA
jgi:hypothetical protein